MGQKEELFVVKKIFTKKIHDSMPLLKPIQSGCFVRYFSIRLTFKSVHQITFLARGDLIQSVKGLNRIRD